MSTHIPLKLFPFLLYQTQQAQASDSKCAVTKAGVPSWKIYVGESSYGRSFKMSKAGCDGAMCTFEGDRYNSEAAPGICTGTPGYISNAEIDRIESLRGDVKTWHDGASNSDMMVYDGKALLFP